MFVCICKSIDEKCLEEMHNQGIDSLSKVIKACGAGGDCGTCAFKISRILKDKNSIVEVREESTINSPLKASND